MSDIEEPPAKITKIELAPPSIESAADGPEEGQEEWLSEGVLTDDDYNAGAEQERSDSNLGNTSQDDSTMPSMNEESMENAASVEQEQVDSVQETEKPAEQNIEQTLNNLENSQVNDHNLLPDDLDTFLIRKTDGKVVEKVKEEEMDKESEIDESVKQSDEEDDGHNTDDLLRMLGEDDEKVNKNEVLKTIKEKKLTREPPSSDDDDDYIFEGAKVTRLKVAKNALIRKYPASKAVPEDLSDRDSDSELSSDEASTVKKMFGMTRQVNIAAKSTTKSAVSSLLKRVGQKTGNLVGRIKTEKSTQPTVVKQYMNKNLQIKSILKNTEKVERKSPKPQPHLDESDEIINEAEFLEEDDFDLDEEFAEGSDGEGTGHERQRIMRPEQMDEEVPTDGESHSEDGSLYDELPSSDSEDLDEWFTLDIRAERAGDYIPLLGAKAHQLLTEEKQRVSSRLSTLRQSLSAITDSGRQQAEQLRKANNTLAELDAMLTAS